MHRVFRRLSVGLVTAAMALTAVPTPASAQLPGFPELPGAPDGALGVILDPLEDLLEQITEPLGDALGDIPLDNAVRLTGQDAVEAAVAMSQITFESSPFALIGRDDVFADTLSSVSAQGITGAPLLLTQTDGLDDRTAEELDRLGVSQIVVLGSTDAISEELFETFVDMYGEDSVVRIGGPSRVETAALLAEYAAPDAAHAVLMRAYPDEGADQSQAYADALSVGPYGSVNEYPALLTTSDELHPAALEYLEGNDSLQEITIIGGEAAIGSAVEDQLTDMGLTVTRIAGENRWDTSILIAKAMGFLDAADASRLILTEGGSVSEPLWAAGFSAAAQGAVFEAPVILADGALLPPETLGWLGDGLLSNALRLSNLPLICNSFVRFLACETVALLLLGPLDEVNELTGGVLEQLLGPAFDPLAEALEGAIPGPGDLSPGIIGQILSLIGVGGSEEDVPPAEEEPGPDEEEDPAFAAAMASQPAEVQAAFRDLVGPEGSRISASQQAVLSDVLANLLETLGGPVDTSDPAQAAALVTVIESIASTMGDRSGNIPLGELNDLLTSLEGLVVGLLDTTALADLVAGLGIDTLPVVEDLVGTVSGILDGGLGFQSAESLVDRFGPEAQPLADTLARIVG